MKQVSLYLFLIVFLGVGSPAMAQLDLPMPSPHSAVEQRVGLTDIRIEYSSPGVKDRTIWGELVPYDKMWRTGANMATTFETSTDIKINGKELKAGKYALFTIPGKEEWTIIFNNVWNQGGTSRYDEAEDALRITVEPQTARFRERMTFLIANTTYTAARVDLEWAKLRISFNIEADTDGFALANIESAVGGVPGIYASAARYTLRVEDHYDIGLEWINKSLSLDESWYAYWIKGRILHAQEKHREAYAAMVKAKELGEEAESFFYRDNVEEALKTWPKK